MFKVKKKVLDIKQSANIELKDLVLKKTHASKATEKPNRLKKPKKGNTCRSLLAK